MKITTASLLPKYLEAEMVKYIFGVPGTPPVLLYDVLNKLATPDRPVIVIAGNGDFLIDPDEVPPIERWVKGLGKLNARLDYLRP